MADPWQTTFEASNYGKGGFAYGPSPVTEAAPLPPDPAPAPVVFAPVQIPESVSTVVAPPMGFFGDMGPVFQAAPPPPPPPPPTPPPPPPAPVTDSQYWAWNDPRWAAWSPETPPEAMKYAGWDLWEKLLRSAGFEGDVYKYIEVEAGIGSDGLPYYGSTLDLTDAAKRGIDTLRARGYDFRRKHPDRRTYNTYWGFFTPDGQVQDVKIKGDDGSGNLFKIAMFMAPVWLGPLAGALSVPTPVLSAGINIAAGADPLRAIAGAALPTVVQTIMPAVSVLPDTSIGPILQPEEWLGTGAALPTVDIAAELLTAPQLFPELSAPVIEPAPQFLIEPPRFDIQPVIDPVESWGPVFEPAPVIEVQPAPIFEPEPLPLTEPVALPPIYEPVQFLPEPLPLTEPVALPPVYEPVQFLPETLPVNEPVEIPPAFEPEPVQFEPVPVVELPPVETMAPIQTIDAAPPTIEPVEVFTQPPEVPTVYEDEYLFNVPSRNLFPEFEGPLLTDPFAALDDFSAFDPYAGAEIPPAFIDDGWEDVGVLYPPAYDVVTVDEASQLSTDILVGGSGGGMVEVGGNFAPNPSPANPDLSVGQVLKDANAIMLDALKLVDSWRRLTNPPSPNRVAQARVGSSTVRALPNGMIETVDAAGRVTRKRPPVGQPQMTTDGSMIVNNGDGTYTSISPSGASATMRYPADGTATAAHSYTTPLLIGGAILALAIMR